MTHKPFPNPVSCALCCLAALLSQVCGAAGEPLYVGNVDFVRPTDKATIIDATVKSLRERFPERDVRRVEIPVTDLEKAIASGKIDIFVTSAGHSFRLQQNNGTRVIATLVTPDYPDPNHGEGAAVLVRKDDAALRTLADLRGRRLAANTPVSFTGYHIPMGEIAKIDRDWEHFFSSMMFVGGGAALGEALEAVADGRADAAFSRLCYWEMWAKGHPSTAAKLRVLGSMTGEGEACARSSELYPNWTVTATASLSAEDARRAAIAIMNVKPDENGNYWGVATDFLHVDRLFERLRIGKYAYLRQWTLKGFLSTYWPAFALALLALAGLVLHSRRADYLVRRRTAQLQRLMSRQRALQEKARDAAEHLETLQKMGALGQVSGMLSHELRQPLAAVSFYLDGLKMLLSRGAIGPADMLEEPLDEIERQLKKADGIVEHARQYARSARVGSRRVWCRLADVLSGTVENYQVSRKNPPAIEKDFAGAGVWVKADPLELECAVFNLLKNAGEAAQGAAHPTVRISAKREGDRVAVAVEDNGPALSDEGFRRLFAVEASEKEGGLGLGLSIVRGLLEAYGAKLCFARLPGGGLRASFALPCAESRPEEKGGKNV
ncbi:MAG: histidine kinase [Burkholderia sp.]